MLTYIIPVIIMICVIAVKDFWQRKYNKEQLDTGRLENVSLQIIFIYLFVIAAIRDNSVGTDYREYLRFFRVLAEIDWQDVYGAVWWKNGEYVISVLGYVARYVNANEYIVCGMLYAIILAGIYSFINKYSQDKLFSLYLFATMSFFNMSMNIMRQYVAAVLVLKAIEYLSKDWKKYILFILLAGGFHKTAIVMGLLVAVVKYVYDIRVAGMAIASISMILLVWSNEILLWLATISNYGFYITQIGESNIDIKILFNGMMFVIGILFYRQFMREDKHANIWIWSASIAFCINLFSINMHVLNRLLLYFMLTYIVYIPNFMLTIKNDSLRCVCKWLLITSFGMYYGYLLLYTSCYDTVPYNIIMKF